VKRSLFVLLLCVACGPAPVEPPKDPLPFPAAGPDAAPNPAEMGPYPVGVRTIEILDTGRKKPDGSPRKLVTEIWYPATQDTKGKEGASYDIREVFTPEQQAMIGTANVPILKTAAVRDAPPAATHGPFPLIVFSHGQAAIRWQSTYLTVFLASHGYIVASPDHEGGTLYDVVRGQLSPVTVGVETRPQDVTYVANRLSKLPEGDPLKTLVDIGHFGVAGHSFGAFTALRVAVTDKRIKAIVPQAPVNTDLAWIGFEKPVLLGIPVQIQGAHEDRTLPWDDNVAPAWAAQVAPAQLLDVVHGGHFTFSDLCQFDLATLADQVHLDVMGTDIKKVLSDGCGPTNPPATTAQPLMRQFAIGFFNVNLKGSAGSKKYLTQSAADAYGAGVAQFTDNP
jgi:predicted dienelactone hydrolase